MILPIRRAINGYQRILDISFLCKFNQQRYPESVFVTEKHHSFKEPKSERMSI